MLQVNVDELLNGLSFLKDIVPRKPHIPTLKNVLFSPDGDTLTLRGADLGKAGYIEIPCEFSDGIPDFLVQMDKLFDFVSVARKSNDTLRFEFETGGSLNVLLEDDSVTTFSLTDVDEFPDMMEIHNAVEFKVDSTKFVSALNMSLFTDSRYTRLDALHIFNKNNKLMVESTSQLTGGIVTVQEVDEPFDVSVTKGIEKTLSRQSKIDTDWLIEISKDKIFIGGEGWLIGYSLVTDPYFDISRMYNNSNINRLVLNREEFLQHINLISAVVSDDSLLVSVKYGKINLYAKDEGSSEKRESSIPIQDGEQDNDIILSISELTKIMGTLKEEFFKLQIGDSREPVLIYENNERMYFTLPSNR